LYYTLSGNYDLRPENAHQVAAGIHYQKRFKKMRTRILISFNMYYNRITDKIVAIPTKNLFVWSMLNFGRVDIYGSDISVTWETSICKHVNMKLLANYAWQRAIDMTDRESKTYRHQIPYTPRHSLAATAGFELTWLTLSYNLLAVGSRYKLGQNITENRLPPYFDHSIGIAKTLYWKHIACTLSVEALNLANQNYEIVANFPVQGISWRIKTGIIF
jgi:outer membrane cobalamin receptor